jgi:hypothetical protein
MKTSEDIVNNLFEWCEDQRDMMLRQIEMMKSGHMHLVDSDGRKMVDETNFWIGENERRVAELNHILAKIETGSFDP